jgi:hypothetical protein
MKRIGKIENLKISYPKPDLHIIGVSKALGTILKYRSMDRKGHLKQSPHEYRAAVEKINHIIYKHEKALDEIGDVVLEYEQLAEMINPTVYIARTTDVKTGIEYFTAKSFWPIKDFKKKVVKIYLGKASQYDNDTKSLKAKSDAIEKMRQTLARRVRAGEI